MKKILFSLLMLCVITGFATHNRSAEILYKRIAPFTGYTYSITVIRYTDHGTAIADRCEDTVRFGDGQQGLAQRSNGGVLANCNCSFCGELVVNEPGFTLKKNVYSIVHTYSVAGTYVITSQDPNRNGNIINIPNSINLFSYVEAVIYASPTIQKNSSPVFTNLPADKGFVNGCYYHHPGAYDADGDSLSYELAPCKTAYNQPIPGYTYPSAGPGGYFGVDATTGLLSWCSPQAQGEYNFVILVREWRKINCNGAYQYIGSVMRDMQAVIGTGTPPSITISSLQDTCIVAGTTYSKNFYVSSPSSQLSVVLLGASTNPDALPMATLNPTTAANTIFPFFTWNTNCSHAKKQANQIVYSAEQSTAARYKVYRQFNVKVLPPAPKIYSVTVDTNVVKLKWKKVNGCNGNIKGYNIYRKVGPNYWSHSNCETGVPLYSGFSHAFFNSVNDTTFNDSYYGVVVTGSIGNYIVTTVMNDCSESYADTVRTVSFIVGVKENNLADAGLSVYPNPFLNTLTVNLNGLTFGQVESNLYSVEGKMLIAQVDKNCSGALILKTNDLKPGIYFLRLITEKGTLVKKVVKE